MPIPVLPVLGSLLGGVVNGVSQIFTNKSNQDFSEKMYDRQRADALTDRDFMNNYNSPAAQMERLKAGGLNPNLVYGNGAVQQPSAPVRPASVEPVNKRAPDGSFIGDAAIISSQMAADLKLKQAQTDNLNAQVDTAKQTQMLQAAQTAKVGAETMRLGPQTEMDRLNLQTAKALQFNNIETAMQRLQKLRADTQFTLDANERAALLNSNNLAKGVEEVLNLRASRANTFEQTAKMREEIALLKKEGLLRDFDIKMRNMGIPAGAGVLERVVSQMLDGGNWRQKFENFNKNAKADIQQIISSMKKPFQLSSGQVSTMSTLDR